MAANLMEGIRTESGLKLYNSILWSKPLEATYISEFDELLGENQLRRGDVIEIISSAACESSKLAMLYYLTMTALLNPIWKAKVGQSSYDVSTGGRGQSVVWMDCTAKRFDIRRLASYIHNHLETQLANMRVEGRENLPQDIVEIEVKNTLKNLYVFSPSSTIQLASTIQSLPEFIKSVPNSKDIGYLIIDSLGEFIWSDRDMNSKKDSKSFSSSSAIPPIRRLLSSIAHIRSTLSPIIFITQFILNTTPTHHSQEGHPFFPNHLPSPWPLITTPSPLIHQKDPLRPIILPNSDSNSFNFKYSISLFPPSFSPTSIMMTETLKTKEAKKQMDYLAIVRGAGGKEIGGWIFGFDNNMFSG